MSVYTVTDTEVGAYAKTLAASVIDTITFRDASLSMIEVTNEDGAAPIHITVDGSDPVVEGAATYRLPATICAREIRVPQSPASEIKVKLISAGTPTYSVAKG